jgi:hypothetical protein
MTLPSGVPDLQGIAPQEGDDDDAVDTRSGKSQSSSFHPESLRLKTTRKVKELLDNASNKGSDVQGR